MSEEKFKDGEIVHVKAHLIDSFYITHSGYFRIAYHYTTDEGLHAMIDYLEDEGDRYSANIKYMRKITEFERIMLSVTD